MDHLLSKETDPEQSGVPMVNSSGSSRPSNGRARDPATHGGSELARPPPKTKPNFSSPRTETLPDPASRAAARAASRMLNAKCSMRKGAPSDITHCALRIEHWTRGHSSVGRASALQAECRRFESDCLHHTQCAMLNAQCAMKRRRALRIANCALRIDDGRVAQLVRASH